MNTQEINEILTDAIYIASFLYYNACNQYTDKIVIGEGNQIILKKILYIISRLTPLIPLTFLIDDNIYYINTNISISKNII